MTFEIPAELPENFANGQAIALNTPTGPINIIFKKNPRSTMSITEFVSLVAVLTGPALGAWMTRCLDDRRELRKRKSIFLAR